MARLLPSIRTQRTEERSPSSTEGRPDPRRGVLGAGAFAAGVLLGSGLGTVVMSSSGGLRQRAGQALPGDGVDVPIGGSGGDGDGDDSGMSGATDPSLEEVDERTGSDVEAEPAEPGAMQVDEELLEEAVDDEEQTPEEAIAESGAEESAEPADESAAGDAAGADADADEDESEE